MNDPVPLGIFQMRDLTARTSFLLRKKLDSVLHWALGWKWVPLYTSVTFSRMRYHLCVQNKKWQDQVSPQTCLDSRDMSKLLLGDKNIRYAKVAHNFA